jgi:hypothetical protein
MLQAGGGAAGGTAKKKRKSQAKAKVYAAPPSIERSLSAFEQWLIATQVCYSAVRVSLT